jgi:unsaturated rhamnogalacturonyl hydrolase
LKGLTILSNAVLFNTKLDKSSSPLEWAKRACDTMMEVYTPDQLPPANRWHYHQGVFLQAMEKVWQATGEAKYLNYIRDYVNLYVSPEGELTVKDHLDDIMPGQLLFVLDENFDDPRYRKLADFLRGLLNTWKTTSDGGFWHKDIYPNQMWLDGIYMAGVFSVRYAAKYNDPDLFDVVVKQALLMYEHLYDEKTGLLYHAWDETRSRPWADPVTGRSPEFWGRSVGWYGFALCEILEYLPENHPQRSKFISILQRFVDGLVQFQEPTTGLWYQVVDKGDRPENWLELSCSTLFVFTIAHCIRDGYIEESYNQYVQKGYEGIQKKVIISPEGLLQVPDVCIGTSAGDFDYYCARDKKTNDLHGTATYVHMLMELAKAK